MKHYMHICFSVCVYIGKDRDGVRLFTTISSIESVVSVFPFLIGSHTQSLDTPPCLLISKLYHIFPLAIFSVRIKTVHLFSSSNQPCLTETEAEGPKSISLVQVTSWLIFKGSEPAEDKRHKTWFHIPPPTDTITPRNRNVIREQKMKWVKKVDKGEPRNLRADGMLSDCWEDLKA